MSTAPELVVDRIYGRLYEATEDNVLVRVHNGHSYADGSETRASELLNRGGSLNWVTISWPPIDMWDLHVGILVDAGCHVRVGIHVHDYAPPSLAGVAHDVGPSWGGRTYSAPAQETQWNIAVAAEPDLERNVCHEALRLSEMLVPKLRADGLLKAST